MATRRTPAAKKSANPRRDARRAVPDEWPGRAVEAADLATLPGAPPSSGNGDAPPPPPAAVEAPPARRARPILTLDLLVPPREIVSIFGVNYEMVSLDEFSQYHRQRLFNAWGRVGELLDRVNADEELTRAEQALLEESYTRVIKAAVPDISQEVIDRLLATQKDQLIAHFFELTGAAAVEALANQADRSTGASRSPDSSGSTAPATPPPGSTSPTPS